MAAFRPQVSSTMPSLFATVMIGTVERFIDQAEYSVTVSGFGRANGQIHDSSAQRGSTFVSGSLVAYEVDQVTQGKIHIHEVQSPSWSEDFLRNGPPVLRPRGVIHL